MSHPVIHAEIRSEDPDATRSFFAELFGWKVASEGGFPGYTFIDTGSDNGPAVAISPRQGADDEVLFFVSVDDVGATLAEGRGAGWQGHPARPGGARGDVRGTCGRPGPQGRHRSELALRPRAGGL